MSPERQYQNEIDELREVLAAKNAEIAQLRDTTEEAQTIAFEAQQFAKKAQDRAEECIRQVREYLESRNKALDWLNGVGPSRERIAMARAALEGKHG